MPGINLVFSWDKDIEKWDKLFSKTQHLMKHNHKYSEKTILSDSCCIIGSTKYESYPLSSFDFNNYKIIIDGIVYNKGIETTQSELSRIVSLLDSDTDKSKREVEEWLFNSDGEYNILFYDLKKQNLYIFNDALGRLPLYYYVDDKIIVLSREISFITPFVKEIVFDKETLAEYLLFSTPLEDRTLISNVRRLRSGTLMKVRGAKKDLSFSPIHVFNLDEKRNKGKSVKENAVELKNIFLDACNDRVQSLRKSNIIVSLSGGLDSRAVALALKKIGASFLAATFIDCESRYAADAEIAKIVAEKLQIPWKLFQLPKARIREIEKLLQYKGGLNYVGMKFILNFFEGIKKEYGTNISYWTGDEGNWSVGDNCPARRLHNTDELVQYIMGTLGGTNLERIERYLDIDVQRLKDKIKNIVQQYPERDLTNKYFHFVFFEYLFKLQYEGEDRNRIFFWSVAPMYSISFFDYTLNIPNNQKKYHNLYREFLNALSPEIAKIRNSSWNYPVTSKTRVMLREIEKRSFNKLPFTFRNIIYKIRAAKKETYRIDPELKEYLVNIFGTSATISENFPNFGLKTILGDRIKESEFWNLLTIVAFINKTEKELKDRSITVR